MSSALEQFEELRTKVDLIKDEFGEVQNTLEEIRIAVVGNSKLGLKGLAKRQEEDSQRISALEQWKTNLNLRIARWGGAGSVIGLFVYKLGETLFEKLTKP